ncbi:hypothetical protein SH528x_004479 [Novipirellula sp. SH528]|uniref:hypothetical protein n=1 Tax=Novipirellula sp. SH528 TaxID=3454466 RepID=UPI003FA01C39
MMLAIPAQLRDQLVTKQQEQLERPHPDQNLLKYDAVVLTHGLGPAVYLTLDGRILIWDYAANAEPEFTDRQRDIGRYVTIGARSLRLPRLTDLIPKPVPGSQQCDQCHGLRWSRMPMMESDVVCWVCDGFGWISVDGHPISQPKVSGKIDEP